MPCEMLRTSLNRQNCSSPGGAAITTGSCQAPGHHRPVCFDGCKRKGIGIDACRFDALDELSDPFCHSGASGLLHVRGSGDITRQLVLYSTGIPAHVSIPPRHNRAGRGRDGKSTLRRCNTSAPETEHAVRAKQLPCTTTAFQGKSAGWIARLKFLQNLQCRRC